MEWFAGQITDPVLRLKYLKAVAPPPRTPAGLRARRALHRLWPLLLLAAAGGFFLFRTPSGFASLPTPVPRPRAASPVRVQPLPQVWLVDKSADSETYSNGLRIDDRYAVSTHPRSYLAFPANGLGQENGVRDSVPVGIVYHTTESRQAPFAAEQNPVLKKIGESLLDYVTRKRAYNFLIDRFGRIYRVVDENDAANHAGYSVWSDGQWVYLNLNESFLGISFEARTQPGQLETSISPAQVRSAAMLTEMLQNRYRIPAANCVTHAQVSVNPSNRRVGYHTDWASSFPFAQVGLPDNYQEHMAAVELFGFESDPGFERSTGLRMSGGVEQAEEKLESEAASFHMTVPEYRKQLQERYRKLLAIVRRQSGRETEESE
ncbi:MAG TPA: peptidoglycan recognition family protein [Bryobacteraceae bacterium]|nr:peptidoglycan recognition family protein [Bryobacteraceae bacterium]